MPDMETGVTTESTAVVTAPKGAATGTTEESTQQSHQPVQVPDSTKATDAQKDVDVERVLRENARLKRALKNHQERAQQQTASKESGEGTDLLDGVKKQVDEDGNELYEYDGMLVPKAFAERQARLAAEVEEMRTQAQRLQAEQFAQYKQEVQDEVVSVIKAARESIADFGDPETNSRVENLMFNHFDSTIASMLNSGAAFDEKTIGDAVKSAVALVKTVYAAGAEAQLADNQRYRESNPVKTQGQAGVPTKPVGQMSRAERAAYAKAIAEKVERERSGTAF